MTNMQGRTRAPDPMSPWPATPAVRRALVRLFSTPPWAGGTVRWSCRSAPFDRAPVPWPKAGPAPADRSSNDEPVDAIVAIPARNESDRIEACLEACTRSAHLSGLCVRLLVLVNGSADDTTERALAWAVRYRRPIVLVDVDFVPPFAHAGAARRLALELAGLGAAPDTMLLTTDADARPAPGWISANARHLRAGATLVCGRVAFDPAEASRLPPSVEVVGEIEGRYKRASLELEHLVDPDPWNPWPHHGQASGASLAIRAEDLFAVGGVPPVPCGEDRALAACVRVHDRIVVHADDVEVEVSCRLHGRAPGGMADALQQRADEPDPPCDEALEPARVLHARLVTRARVRALWPSAHARADALVELGIERDRALALARSDSFERVRDALGPASDGSTGTRMRVTDLRRELPALLDMVRAARGRRLDDCHAPSNTEPAGVPGALSASAVASPGLPGPPGCAAPSRAHAHMPIEGDIA